MLVATLFCWTSFLIIVYSVDPFSAPPLGFALFYLSLFFSLVGTLSILGFLFRYLFNKNQFVSQQVVTSFRQSILFSILVVIALYLQSKGLVTWWNLLILVALLAVVEVFLQKRHPDSATAEEGPRGS